MSDEKKVVDEENVETESTKEPDDIAEPVEEETESVDSEQDPLTAAKQEAEENYQRFLRAQADFDNFRRRSRKEREDLQKYASQSIAEGLLPAIDNLERALSAENVDAGGESLLKGIEMVYRQILEALEREGVVPIESVGKPFDPQFHQAVMTEQDPNEESGVVLEELQKGYMLKDRVIRPSMVKVNA